MRHERGIEFTKYNIDSIKFLRLENMMINEDVPNNGREETVAVGWVFDETEPVEIQLEGYQVKIERYNRDDVFQHYNLECALPSGFTIYISNIDIQKPLEFIFKTHKMAIRHCIDDISENKEVSANKGYSPICESKTIL